MLEFALSQETARTAPLLPPVEGWEENPVFRFILFHRWSKGQQYPLSQRKRNFLFLRVLRSMGQQCATPCFLTLAHNPFLPAAKRVRFGDDVPPHAPLASPVWDPGSSVRNASERTTFCTIHPYSLSLHHHRYVDCAVGAACTASGGVAHAAQPVSLVHVRNSTRLRDSVRQATSQVQRRSRDIGGSPERPYLARGDCCPPGKGCNRAGPSSRDEAGVSQPLLHRTQERW